jgi:hypothetical protein
MTHRTVLVLLLAMVFIFASGCATPEVLLKACDETVTAVQKTTEWDYVDRETSVHEIRVRGVHRNYPVTAMIVIRQDDSRKDTVSDPYIKGYVAGRRFAGWSCTGQESVRVCERNAVRLFFVHKSSGVFSRMTVFCHEGFNIHVELLTKTEKSLRMVEEGDLIRQICEQLSMQNAKIAREYSSGQHTGGL